MMNQNNLVILHFNWNWHTSENILATTANAIPNKNLKSFEHVYQQILQMEMFVSSAIVVNTIY